jgi:hypothetical protein
MAEERAQRQEQQVQAGDVRRGASASWTRSSRIEREQELE